MSTSTERAGLGRLIGRVNSLRDVGRRRISITPRESTSPPEHRTRTSSAAASSEALSAPLTPKGESLGENSGQRGPLSQRLLSRIHRRTERSASTGTHSVRRAQEEPGKSVRRAQSLMPLLPNDGKRSGRGSLGDGASKGKASSASASGAGDPAAVASTKTKVSGKQPPSPRPAAMEVQRSRHRTKRRPGASEVVEVQVEVCNVPASRLDTPPPKTPPRAASRQPSHHSSPSVVVGIPLAEAEYGSPAFVLGAHPYGSGHYAAIPGPGRYGPSPLADSKDGLAGKAPARFKCGETGREAGAGKPSAFAAMLEFDHLQVEEEAMAAEEAAAVEEAILSSLQTAAIEGSADTEKGRPPAAASSAADGEHRDQRSSRGDGKPRRLWSAEEALAAEEEDQYGWPPSPPRPPPRSAAAPLLSPQRSDGARPRRSAAAPPGVTVLWNPDATKEGGGGSEGSVAAVAAGDEGNSIPHHPSFPRVGDEQIDFLIAKFDNQGGDGTPSASGRRRRRKKKTNSTASGSAASSANPSLLHEQTSGGEGGRAHTLDAGNSAGAGDSAGGSSGAGSGSSSRRGTDGGVATSRVASFAAVPDAGAAFGVTLRSALSPRRPTLAASDDTAPPEPPPRNGLPPEPPPRGVGNGAERRKEELRKSVKFALDGQAPSVRLPQQSSAANATAAAALGARVGAEALEKVQKQLSAQRKLIAKQADAISSLVAERAAVPGNSLDSLTEDSLTLARPSAPRAAATISSSLEVQPPRRRGVRQSDATVSSSVAELQEAELQAKRWPTWETSPRRLDLELSQIAIPDPETETETDRLPPEPPEPPPRDRLAELREPPEPPRRRRRKKKSHGGSIGSTVGSSSIVSSDCSVSSSPDSVSSSVLLAV